MALIDQGVASTTNFLSGIIIGRSCTKEDFGLYMLGFTIILFLLDGQQSLISTPYTVFSPRLKSSARSLYTGSALIHQFGLSILAIAFLGIAAIAVSLGLGPKGLAPVLWSLVAVIALILLRDYARHICFAQLHMSMAVSIDFCVGFVQIGGLALMAWLGFLSPGNALLMVGVAGGCGAFFWILKSHRELTLSSFQAIADFKLSWSLGKWTASSTLLWTLSKNLYPWILTFFHGTAPVGVWAACVGIVNLGNPLFLGMKNYLSPRIAHGYAESGHQGLRHLVWQGAGLLGLIITPLCIALIFFGSSLVVLFYSSKYAGSGIIVTLLALNLLVWVLGVPFSEGLFVLNRADVDFKINFLALFSLLTLGLWLVRLHSTPGAALGLLASSTVTLAARGIAFAVVMRSSPQR
jgi:O-antigen/teichoic acid export membrane protein